MVALVVVVVVDVVVAVVVVVVEEVLAGINKHTVIQSRGTYSYTI